MPEQPPAIAACPLPRQQVIERYFLEHRQKLIDIAAFLDRVDRAADDAGGAPDYRVRGLMKALDVLRDGAGDRARRVLELLSDPTTEPVASARQLSAATGAYAAPDATSRDASSDH